MLRALVCLALASVCAVHRVDARMFEVSGVAHTTLDKLGLDDRYFEDGDLRVFVEEEELMKLKDANVDFDIVKVSMPLYERFPNATSRTMRMPPSGYLNLAQITQFLDDTIAQFPNLVAYADLHEYGPLTFEGRKIPMVKISDNVATDEDEPNVIIVSAHHYREIVTPEIAMDVIRRLTAGYGVDAAITQIVNTNQIYVVPVVNVDGYVHVFEVADLWRKNRFNTYGVDCNRNYDQNWLNGGGSDDPSSQTYKGGYPLSESESYSLTMFERHKNVAKLMDFHSYGREVLPGFRYATSAPAIHDYNWDRGTFLSTFANYRTRVPSADAEHHQGAIQNITSFAWLTETHSSFQPPIQSAYEEVARVWPLTFEFLAHPIPVQGHVVSETGAPIRADLVIPGVCGPNAPHTRHSDATFGRFHLFLVDGTYPVTFVADGYAPTTQTITVDSSNPQDNLIVVLESL